MQAPEAILIDDADLPSLVAAAIRPRQGLVLVHTCRGDAAEPRRRAIVAEHESALAATMVVLATGVGDPSGSSLDDAAKRSLIDALVLVEASAIAAATGAPRGIWPRQLGRNPQLIEAALERATLAAALAAGDHAGGVRPVVETPLLDLTDEQVVDLAEDTGVPARSFWPCRGGDSTPCGRCGGCTRWMAAFEAQGVPWPWAPATTRP